MTELAIGEGHKRIYQDLLAKLASADVCTSARNLGLVFNADGQIELPFGGMFYLISAGGVRLANGKRPHPIAASALIHYVLLGSEKRPAGKFVAFSELAGPLFKHGGYSSGALESPIAKRFQGRVEDLIFKAESMGGRLGGQAGQGAISLVFDLVPHIPLQLVFYDRDDEFPARATLLCDQNATLLIDFEALAVLTTVFVNILTGE